MNQRIDGGPAISPSTGGLQEGGAAQEAVIGSFMGERVLVETDIKSLIEDAMEELSFSASEEAERKLDERAEGKGKGRGLDKILFYISHLDQAEQDKMRSVFDQIAKLKQLDAQTVLDTVGRAFKDPTDRHAALNFALEELEKSGLPKEQAAPIKAAITEAVRELEAAEGRAINAGYNVAGVDAPGLGLPPSSLKVLYRDTVIDFASYEKTFSFMMEKFGPEEFPKAVNYLIRALGSDMSAMTPSSPKAALKEVMDGLYMVESLGTIYAEAGGLLKGLAERHGPEGHGPGEATERQIIDPLLRYKDMPAVMPQQVNQDMPFLISDNPSRDAELTQGVRELARKMPHKLYATPEARQNVLNALQEILDTAVDREEEAMEE